MIDLLIKSGYIITMKGGKKAGKIIDLGVLGQGDIGIRDKKIYFLGRYKGKYKKCIDAEGNVVLPGFIDPHTHALFAGNRVDEYEMKIKGKSYMEIRKEGGGIMSTVKKTREANKKELSRVLRERLKDMLKWGVTSVEIKSGYGLDIQNEIKMLEVINEMKDEFNVYPTFLGAHDFPPEKDREVYINEILDAIPTVSKRKLANFIDVFCEENVYTPVEAEKILLKGKKYKLIPKIHADEIKSSGGSELAGKVGCISADHLLYPSDKGLKLMKKKGTVAVLLPFTSFYLKENPAPVDKIRDNEIPIAIGTDFNPGSSPTKFLPLVASFSTIYLRLTPEEALAAITINAAFALNAQRKKGSIEIGKDADIVITKYKDFREIFYWFGENPIKKVIRGGEEIE